LYENPALIHSRSTLLDSGELAISALKSWSKTELTLPFDLDQFKHHVDEVFLTIRFGLRTATNWAAASHEIAWWQHKISDSTPVAVAETAPTHAVAVEETRAACRVVGSGWSFTFDKIRGYLKDWTSAGKALIEVDPNTRVAISPCFWRAPIDNDRPGDTDVPGSLPYWKHYGVDALTSQLRSFKVSKNEKTGSVEVSSHTYLSPPILGWGYDVRTLYTVSGAGSLSIKVNVQPTGPKPANIPRLGLNLRLPKTSSRAKWFGLGPGESYPDKRLAQRMGIWSKTIEELETPYDVPQENGNRMETRWLRVVDAYGAGIQAIAVGETNTFSWTAGRHSAAMLENAKHPCDLVAEDVVLLNLSSKVAGVGTAACGPGVREDLQVKVQDDEFEFVLETTSQ
jgi:beta-galactosidase